MGEGKVVGIFYLDFCKIFDTYSHGILMKLLLSHGLREHTLLDKALPRQPGPKSDAQ